MAINEKTTEALNQVPEVQESQSGQGEVFKAAEMKLVMVEYVDADNHIPRTRLAALLPGAPGALFFLDDKVTGKKAAKWFTAKVIAKLGQGG
jgi:hypothetical protein